MLYDIFICHASEDKDAFVHPLVEALQKENIEVWYDEFVLQPGDSIRRSIDKGLSKSRYGAVVLSKSFFSKNWPQYELDGLVERELSEGRSVLLPIWYGISAEDVRNYSLPLAGRKALSSDIGIGAIVREIYKKIHPQESPLVTARDFLLERGLVPPVITDEYWLDVVEASNRVPGYGARVPEESSWDRWSFPFPPKTRDSRQWGERLGWTALQLNWVRAADGIPITPLTPPSEVLSFIRSNPGLSDACIECPSLLLEYAPQLSIAGFAGELEEFIESEYQEYLEQGERSRYYLKEQWALRLPAFGNLEPSSIAYDYFHGGMFGPHVSPYEDADHLFWLLSSYSEWLPREIKLVLTEGMKEYPLWIWSEHGIDKGDEWLTCGSLASAMHEAAESDIKFKWEEDTRDDVINRIRMTIRTLHLTDEADSIFKRFAEMEFPQAFVEWTQARWESDTETD